MTSAFYVATHASSVHPILILMAPSDRTHWAEIDSKFGLILLWDLGASVITRMAPKTQVAGTSVIVDSMVVVKMMFHRGIVPMLSHTSQLLA